MRNATPDVPASVLVDGHRVADMLARRPRSPSASATQRSLLATLPETTFFARYREVFTA